MDEYQEAIQNIECVVSVVATPTIESYEESKQGPYNNIELVQTVTGFYELYKARILMKQVKSDEIQHVAPVQDGRSTMVCREELSEDLSSLEVSFPSESHM